MGEEERKASEQIRESEPVSAGEDNIVDATAEVVEESPVGSSAGPSAEADAKPHYAYESVGNVNQDGTYRYSRADGFSSGTGNGSSGSTYTGYETGGSAAGSESSAAGNGSGQTYTGYGTAGAAGNASGQAYAGYGSAGAAGGQYQYNTSGHEYYKGDSYNGSGMNGGSGGKNGGNGKGKGILAAILVAIFGICVGTGIWGVHHYLGSSTATANMLESAADNQGTEVTGEENAQEDDQAQAFAELPEKEPEADQQQEAQTQPQGQQDQQGTQQQDQQAQAQEQDQQNDQVQQQAPAQDNSGEVSDQVINDAGLVISNEVTPETPLTKVVEKVMPSIVSVYNSYTEQVQSFYGQTFTRQGEAAGSGIIIGMTDDELLIVTNNHVVEGADGLKVQFVNEQTAEAEIKGTDASNDLAVIAVSLTGIDQDTQNAIKVATLGDSDNLKIGEDAIAIGNALGYGQSVTTGIVSAKDREISDETITGTFIQTDAAINPGNSGGALVNINGDVIGINSSKIGGDVVEGMGFAIPISRAIPIIENLMSMETKTKVAEGQQGVIGISGATVTSSVSSAYNMPVGVYVAQIFAGSGAAESELQEGDIITAINGQSITGMEDLQKQLQYYAAGTEVTLTVQRQDGTGAYVEKSIPITLSTKDTLENAVQEDPQQNRNGQEQYGGQNGQEQYGGQEGQSDSFGQQNQDFEEEENSGGSWSFSFPFGF